MEQKRKDLIEFVRFLCGNNPILLEGVMITMVDKHLNSIKSEPNERRAIGNNEQPEKKCQYWKNNECSAEVDCPYIGRADIICG